MTRKRLILEEGASRTHETCSKGAGAAIPARATLLHPQRIIMVSLCRYLQYRKASAGQSNERLEATLPPRKMAIAGNWSKESTVARGTVVGWASRRDTGSARIGVSYYSKRTSGGWPGSSGIPPEAGDAMPEAPGRTLED